MLDDKGDIRATSLYEPPGALPRLAAALALLLRYCRAEKQQPPSRDHLGDKGAVAAEWVYVCSWRRTVAHAMVVAAGALLELEDERTDLTEGGVRVQVIDGDPDRLAVLARLYAQLESGERLVADRYAIGVGMHRAGPAAIWKQYVGPPPLPSDPVEQERFLAQYRVRRRDVEDAVDQMLGCDPEQHHPLRIAWETMICRLANAGISVTERQLIGLPFRCEFSAPLRAELAA